MQFCYPILWKQEAISIFCLILDIFVKQGIFMIIGESPIEYPSKQSFPLGERIHEERGNNMVIRDYGFQDKRLFLPIIFMDRYFDFEL